MNLAPFRPATLDRDKRKRRAEARRERHERAFGEEMARVNLDFTPEQRHGYLQWMRDTVRRSGRELPPSHSVAWMLEVERELGKES